MWSCFAPLEESGQKFICFRKPSPTPLGVPFRIHREVAAIRKLKNISLPSLGGWFVYDKDAADNAVSLLMLKAYQGEWYGQPFELIDWQEQIIRDVFGIIKPNGYRQFNTAYIEIAKSKVNLSCRAVALLLTCGDFEHGGEVYGCASDRQQASIVFDVAVDMVEQCPVLSKNQTCTIPKTTCI